MIRETKYETDSKTGYGLFAPGHLHQPPRYSKKTGRLIISRRPRKVVILKGDIVTGFAGYFASNKDAKTSDTHTAPAGNLGHADGKQIREYVVANLNLRKAVMDADGTRSFVIDSFGANLASEESGIHVSWDMLGVFLNSSYDSDEVANVTSPCQKEITTFHATHSEKRARVSPRFQKTDSFIMMPMYATRDIYEGEHLIWCYPWRALSRPPLSSGR